MSSTRYVISSLVVLAVIVLFSLACQMAKPGREGFEEEVANEEFAEAMVFRVYMEVYGVPPPARVTETYAPMVVASSMDDQTLKSLLESDVDAAPSAEDEMNVIEGDENTMEHFTASDGWNQINGKAVQVALAREWAMVVSSAGVIYIAQIGSGSWQQKDGILKHVSLSNITPSKGPVHIGGVTGKGEVFWSKTPNANKGQSLGWDKKGGILVQTSISDKGIWGGVNASNHIFVADVGKDNWEKKSGEGSYLTISGTRACLVGNSGRVYCADDVKNAKWDEMGPQLFKTVELSGDNLVAVDAKGDVYFGKYKAGNWQKIGYGCKHAAITDDWIYAIDTSDSIFTLKVASVATAAAKFSPQTASTLAGSAFSNATIEFGPGNRVVDCAGGTCKQGANLHIWDPLGTPNQSWTYDPKTQQVSAQGHCMDVAGAGKASGTNVHAWPCYDGPAQKWVVQKNVGPGQGSVQLMNPNSGKCLDVSGAVDKQGQNVQIWDCKTSGHSWDIREQAAAAQKAANTSAAATPATPGSIPQGTTLTSGTASASVVNARGLRLVMQTDGNLVLYDAAKKALWASQTSRKGTGPYRVIMQTDGNLVLYDSKKTALWHTKTHGKGKGPYKAVVQEDGNFVVYDGTNKPLWASGTVRKPPIVKVIKPVEGQAVVCTKNSPIKGGVFRYTGGKLRHYPNPPIASSWDRNWGKAIGIDCTGVPSGPAMAMKSAVVRKSPVRKTPVRIVRKSPVRKSPVRIVRKPPVRKSPVRMVRKSPVRIVRKTPVRKVRKSPVRKTSGRVRQASPRKFKPSKPADRRGTCSCNVSLSPNITANPQNHNVSSRAKNECPMCFKRIPGPRSALRTLEHKAWELRGSPSLIVPARADQGAIGLRLQSLADQVSNLSTEYNGLPSGGLAPMGFESYINF